MLAAHLVSETVPERKHWHVGLKEPISVSRVESLRDDLEPWEVALTETVLRRQMIRNSY